MNYWKTVYKFLLDGLLENNLLEDLIRWTIRKLFIRSSN